jgi:hypothetical protein
VRKSQYQKIVAHHEAGHAVVARLLGVGIAQAFGRGRKPVGSDAGNVITESASFKAKSTPYYREALRIDLTAGNERASEGTGRNQTMLIMRGRSSAG